jgi:predicted Zn finger-like uncharacterized protein
MIISCPECRGRFRIDPTALGTDGRTVRCGKCAHSWLQKPPPPEPRTVGGIASESESSAAARVFGEAEPAFDTSGAETARGEFDESEAVSAPAVSAEDEASVRSRRRTRPTAAAKRSGRWPAVVAWMGLVLVVAGLAGGLYVYRDGVMDTWPETAALYDQLDLAQPGFGLVLAPPQARQTSVDGKTSLVIEGRIENPTKRERIVPKTLRLQLLDKNQRELQVETFDAPARRLLPAQSIPYKFELKDPAEKRDVLLISFAKEKK